MRIKTKPARQPDPIIIYTYRVPTFEFTYASTSRAAVAAADDPNYDEACAPLIVLDDDGPCRESILSPRDQRRYAHAGDAIRSLIVKKAPK